MWAVARIWLRLSDAEFWKLTPYEFGLLRDAYLDTLEVEDERWAVIYTMYRNSHRKKGEKAFKVDQFIPDRRGGKKEKAPKKQQTWKEQLAVARAVTLAFGGRVPAKVAKLGVETPEEKDS